MKVDDYAFTLNSNQRIDEDEDEAETESTQIGRSQKSHKELSKDELNRKVSLNCSYASHYYYYCCWELERLPG